MKTILVPTDGSVAANKALDVALDLALQHGAAVKIMHVLLRDKEPDQLLQLPEIADVEPEIVKQLESLQEAEPSPRTAADIMGDPGAPSRPAPEGILRNIGEHVLEHASRDAEKRGIAAEVLELRDGPAAPAIVAVAADCDADTIVMGTRGLRQIEAVTFGSVSQEVCRTAPCTCVAVH